MRYFATFPGRAWLASMGLVLLGPALASVLSDPGWSLRVLTVASFLGCAAAIAAAGFGMFSHPRETMAFTLVLPFVCWMGFPGLEIMANDGMGIGVAVLLLAIGLIIAAARPAASAKPGQFR